MFENIRLISAGAGSGKTYRLIEELAGMVDPANRNRVHPSKIMVTTFTVKAAAEIRERARSKLLEKGYMKEASELNSALIGTVNSVCARLLQRFAFEAGLSPEIEVLTDENKSILFSQALSEVMDEETTERMGIVADRLSQEDWEQNVRSIIDIARANNIDGAQLKDSAKKSIESFLSFYPKPLKDSLDISELKKLVDNTLKELNNSISEGTDTTAKTQNVVSYLKKLSYDLRSGVTLAWVRWTKLISLDVAVKSKDIIEPLAAFAGDYLRDPKFREDLTFYIETVFRLAAEGSANYSRYKKERGLMDFVDQEAEVLRILDFPEVKKRLSEELEVVMVDEFQDTSPIQLAIFLKLAQIARQSVWVGDPKQSIYAFRGADPKLMRAVIERLGEPGKKDILNTSWRSRQGIIGLTNSIFKKAFDKLPENQVLLEVVRKEHKEFKYNPVCHWNFTAEDESKGNKPWYITALAKQVKKLLEEGRVIEDKGKKVIRKMLPGDLAILARSNADCRAIADALQAEGLQVAVGGTGLLLTAEAVLFLACLKKLVAPKDSLATTQILLLSQDSPDLAAIIDDKLQYEHLSDEQKKIGWGADNKIIGVIDRLRESEKMLSLSDLVQHLIIDLDLYRHVLRWERGSQRQANLQEIMALAGRYEETCKLMNKAATAAGFILFLESIADDADNKAVNTGIDAVSVSTYHSAKGLEWPMVILFGLDSNLNDRLLGITVMDVNKKSNLSDPLSGRWLRFWIWPYGGNYGKRTNAPGISEKFDESEDQAVAKADALEEDKRLLYVGMTRARDCLILPKSPKSLLRWIEDVAGKDAVTFLSGIHADGVVKSPWKSSGKPLEIEIANWEYPLEFKDSTAKRQPAHFYTPPAGEKEYPPMYLSPSELEMSEVETKVGELVSIHDRIKINGQVEDTELGDCLHAIICAFDPEASASRKQEVIQGTLQRLGLEKAIDWNELQQGIERFYTYIKKQYQPTHIHKELPLQMYKDGQFYSGFADMVLETKEGLILIDHKTFQGGDAAMIEKAKSFGAQLGAYKEIIEKAMKRKVVGCCIHFAVSGKMAEVIESKVGTVQM